MVTREKLTRIFLWILVLFGGPVVGAKLFDLVVLAGAWSANPPASLALLPYGDAWPVDTGLFFIPFSAATQVAGFGALIAGWRTPWHYRWMLCMPSVGSLLLLVLTVLAFWPMNYALYHHAIHVKDHITDAESIAMAHRWVMLDWVRVGCASAIYVIALRALTLPYPQAVVPRDSPVVRVLLGLALLGVVAFIVWFVSNLF